MSSSTLVPPSLSIDHHPPGHRFASPDIFTLIPPMNKLVTLLALLALAAMILALSKGALKLPASTVETRAQTNH